MKQDAASVAHHCGQQGLVNGWPIRCPAGYATGASTRALWASLFLVLLFSAHATAAALSASAASVGKTSILGSDRHGLWTFAHATDSRASAGAVHKSSRRHLSQQPQHNQQQPLPQQQDTSPASAAPCPSAHNAPESTAVSKTQQSSTDTSWDNASCTQPSTSPPQPPTGSISSALAVTTSTSPPPSQITASSTSSSSFPYGGDASSSPTPHKSPHVPSNSSPVTPSPTTPESPSVTSGPASQSPAAPSPTAPQQSTSSATRPGISSIAATLDINAAMPEGATQQEGRILSGQAPAHSVTVNMILQGMTEGNFKSTYRDLVLHVTAALSGTSEGRWVSTTNQLIQLRSLSGRHLLNQIGALQLNRQNAARQLLQLRQNLAVSLSLYTNKPELVWYRLKQCVQPESATPTEAADADGGLYPDSALAASRLTEYSARLIRAGVPIDSNSITVSPDYGNLLLVGNSSDAKQHQQNVHRGKLVGGIIVWSVIGTVLLLGLMLQTRPVAACCMLCNDGASSRYLTILESDRTVHTKQSEQDHGQSNSPYLHADSCQTPLSDDIHDLRLRQCTMSVNAASTSRPVRMQYQADTLTISQPHVAQLVHSSAAAVAAEIQPNVDEPPIHGQYHSGAIAPGQTLVDGATSGAKPSPALHIGNSMTCFAAADNAAATAAEELSVNSPTSSRRSAASTASNLQELSFTGNVNGAAMPDAASFSKTTSDVGSGSQYQYAEHADDQPYAQLLEFVGNKLLQAPDSTTQLEEGASALTPPWGSASSTSSTSIVAKSNGQLANAPEQQQ